AATAPENPGALSLTLSPQELTAIEAVFPHDAAAGPRYWPEIMAGLGWAGLGKIHPVHKNH
ncbi:hypothetical protein MJN64_16200, partial [Salmonella enterica subsp. enterica serovar Montevideo]|nr:hypothetical protein [Salmonella enterica subsp. enterica serovar Montevideo]